MTTETYNSPCGELLLVACGNSLTMCDWTASKNHQRKLRKCSEAPGNDPVAERAIIAATKTQLDEYFSGKRKDFDLNIEFSGTPFQKKVWRELLNIPYGKTTTYLRIAANIGSPQSVRAVANAVGANPISIIAPCHRVIGSDGSLHGYDGGLNIKSDLLTFEV